jgi:hypothetical protein
LQRRCDRNRKRSKRRAICCPRHDCYLDSVSKKYQLFADRPGQLQQRGMSRRSAAMLVANNTTVPLEGEWLEAFWCEHCQDTKWYHVRKGTASSGESRQVYQVSLAPSELWMQVTGVTNPEGNPTVGEFTRRHAREMNHRSLQDFNFLN